LDLTSLIAMEFLHMLSQPKTPVLLVLKLRDAGQRFKVLGCHTDSEFPGKRDRESSPEDLS